MNQEMERIELSIEQAKEKIALAKSLEKLKDNPDFKKLFTNKYLNSYAINLVNRKAMHSMQDDKQQLYIEGQIGAIGHLNQFLLFITQEGMIAEKALIDSEKEQDLLHEEEN